MPQNKNVNGFVLRKAQQELIEYLPKIKPGDVLTIQWPTGYGKSYGMALAWKHCKATGIANRLMIVVANSTQRQQIVNDFATDCSVVGASCEGGVWVFERSASSLLASKRGTAEVFVVSVMGLHASSAGGVNTLKDLLIQDETKWMIAFDEYQHYGDEMAWGESAKSCMRYSVFTMAMSATPYRRGANTIFGDPVLYMSYSDAAKSGDVKRMICESYGYKVTIVKDDDVSDYTTDELLRSGLMKKKGLSAWEEKQKIRYSPQYIHPLIFEPIERLRSKVVNYGMRLQMLVRAMSCAHAEVICQQIKTLVNDSLIVDWVGTGDDGKSDKDNKAVIAKFCPSKNKTTGKRPAPEIDILVQVYMAGEGFDSINVCEIVDLFPVSTETLKGTGTTDKQFYGRGSRSIGDVVLHVSVPTDHPLAMYARTTLHDWMDYSGEGQEPKPRDSVEPPTVDLYSFPDISERRIELLEINRESHVYKRVVPEMARRRKYDVDDPSDLKELEELFLGTQQRIQDRQSEQLRLANLKRSVDHVAGRLARVLAMQTNEINSQVIGAFKKKLNKKLIQRFGKSRDAMSIEELEAAFTWMRNELASMRPE